LFSDDNEGKPFSRLQYQDVVKAGKYNERLLGFGSNRVFEEDGYYIRNSLFPKLATEMRVDNTAKTNSYKYIEDNEGLISRNEHREEAQIDPYYRSEEHTSELKSRFD